MECHAAIKEFVLNRIALLVLNEKSLMQKRCIERSDLEVKERFACILTGTQKVPEKIHKK